MGILDDAIREHLDLKRRQGAEEDELKRLEGEAFGPPSRPGDPDFPEQGHAEQAADDAVAADGATEAGLESPPLPEPPSEELAAEAPATAEEPAAPAAPAPATEDASGSGFYDQSEGDLELDLDLSLDEEATRVEDTGEQAAPPAPPEPPPETGEAAAAEGPPATDERPAVEPPIESLDTVEHPFEGAVEETGEAEAVEGELTEEGAEPGEGADEDVLEETPEFLRDAPEDDELWFEQGEPKDFDF